MGKHVYFGATTKYVSFYCCISRIPVRTSHSSVRFLIKLSKKYFEIFRDKIMNSRFFSAPAIVTRRWESVIHTQVIPHVNRFIHKSTYQSPDCVWFYHWAEPQSPQYNSDVYQFESFWFLFENVNQFRITTTAGLNSHAFDSTRGRKKSRREKTIWKNTHEKYRVFWSIVFTHTNKIFSCIA